jgi:hypothetical protein
MKVFILAKDRGIKENTIQVHKITTDSGEAEVWIKESLDNVVLEGEIGGEVDKTTPGTPE